MNALGIIIGILVAFFGVLELFFGGFGTIGIGAAYGAGLVVYSQLLAVVTGLLTVAAGAIIAWRL